MNADGLLHLLTCPVCRDSALLGLDERLTDGVLTCDRCRASYPIRGGIPILLPPDLDTSNIHDELDHLRRHKRRQADYFDREIAEDFEIARPSGTPAAYQWLMSDKFRRSVRLLPQLPGATVVDACCGSGMDAEFLAREGAKVIALDISEGCATRALARAQRDGLDYLVIVGDVEHLPIRSGAADIGYVHDGLHHLPDPKVGIRELARVARRAVSVNEPADALATRLAVCLGIALRREASGNAVARLRAGDVSRELTSAGFQASQHRYVMYYKHEPGRTMDLLSGPGAFHLFRAAAALANLAIGRWGNKLQVTAIRTDATAA
jgi:uncharacterized protein YbaR (Trm112 family)